MLSREPSIRIALPRNADDGEGNQTLQQIEHNIFAESVIIDPTYHYYARPHSQEVPDISDHETLKKTIQVSTLLSQLKENVTEADPVPLTFTNHLSLGNSQKRNSFPLNPQLSETTQDIDAEKLFKRAINNAKREAFALYSTRTARTSFIQRVSKTVCVIGRAGIGKTVFCGMMLKSVLSTSQVRGDGYVFYINCQAVDYTRKCSVLQFLVPSSTHSKESVEILLDELSQSSNVTIFIEGLDKAAVENFSEFSPPAFLYDLNYPSDILKSLLSGQLLQNARKFVTTRTGAFRQLHEAYKPRFVLKVLGLAKEGQDALCEKLCPDDSSYQNVKRHLSEQKNLNDICHVPVYLITLVNYISKRSAQHGAISITDILTSQLQDFMQADQFPKSLQHLKSISKLAFTCKHKKQRSFTQVELPKEGIDVLKPFCSVHESPETLHMPEMSKKYRFTEQIWQDFFAACHLMRFCSADELSKHLSRIDKADDHWETVLKFLFGMCSPVVSRKIRAICNDNSNWNFPEKVNRLKSFLTNSPMGKQYQVLRLCRLVQESQYTELKACLAQVFPEELILRDRLMPNEESALVSMLKFMTSRTVRIKCSPTHPLTFSNSDGIASFLGAANTNHVVETLHVRATIGIPEMKLVIRQLNNLTLLELVECNITDRTTWILAESLSKRPTPLNILNLSKNPITSLEYFSQCIENVDVWWLTKNKIKGNGLKSFCSKIRYSKRPIKQLDLGGNPIARQGIEHITSCVNEIKVLGLGGCDLTSDDIKLLTRGISTLQQPMTRLFLDWNVIGDLGAKYLAQCASKIHWLHLGNCGISMVGVREFRDQNCCRIMGLPMQ